MFIIKHLNKKLKVQQNLASITIQCLIYLAQSYLLSKICREMAKRSLRYHMTPQIMRFYNNLMMSIPLALQLICGLKIARVKTCRVNLHKQ